MSSKLFREEVLNANKDKLYGDVILSSPVSLKILAILAGLFLVCLIMVLSFGSYSRKETVPGFVTPESGIIKIHSPQSGKIDQLLVKESSQVHKGQELLTINSDSNLTSGDAKDELLLTELNAMLVNQQYLQQQQIRLNKSHAQKINTKLLGLQAELDNLGKTKQTLERRLEIAKSKANAAQSLAKQNNLSKFDYQKLVEEELSILQSYQDLLRQIDFKNNQIAELNIEADELPVKLKTQTLELDNSISNLKQKIIEISGHKLTSIQAPQAGTITAIAIKNGQFANPNTPLLSLVPLNSKFHVELFVPSRAIGFIEPNQVVRIRYNAFPYQRFGTYEAKITEVSKNIIIPGELSVPLELKEPVYRITAKLDSEIISAYGKRLPLQAGMGLEADIILDKRSIFSWIFEPILSIKGKV